MTWSTPRNDLRILLSDGATDKLQAFKQVFGMQNGVNTVYKTYEFRRLTDFSSTATSFPLGVYVNGDRLASSAITTDDIETGYFEAATSYDGSYIITATYYIQWFTDAELDNFLVRSSQWLGLGDVYTDVPSGLITAALKYSASEAYQKLALMYARNSQEVYRLEDSPDEKRFTIVDAYNKASRDALKDAERYRDDFYTRKGQYKAPLFGTVSGNINNPTVS